MSGDLFGDPVVTAPQPKPVKWTERMMLDLLSERYTQDAGNGPRWVYAEHVRSEAGFGRFDYDLFRTAERGAQ